MMWADYDRTMLALTLWREARGEGRDGMRAVGHVIQNRIKASMAKDWGHAITKRWQFSSMTAAGDPELILWPEQPDQSFEEAMQIADLIYGGGDFDLTQGATFYFNPAVVRPDWAKDMVQVATIGHHDFYVANRRTT